MWPEGIAHCVSRLFSGRRQADELVPVLPEPGRDVEKDVRKMLEYRDKHGPVLGIDLRIRDLIDEGRQI